MCSVHRIFRNHFLVALAVLSITRFPAALEGQGLSGRSQVQVGLGLAFRGSSGITTSGSGIRTEAKATGVLGLVVCSRWLNEDLALTASAGLLSAGAKISAGTGAFESRAASVLLLFVGARQYFLGVTFGSQWRPYASVELGPVVGSQSWLELGEANRGESVITAAMGARIGGGIDFLLGRRAVLAVSAGYHLMTDFPHSIGGKENHSGPDIGLSMGVRFGGKGDRTK